MKITKKEKEILEEQEMRAFEDGQVDMDIVLGLVRLPVMIMGKGDKEDKTGYDPLTQKILKELGQADDDEQEVTVTYEAKMNYLSFLEPINCLIDTTEGCSKIYYSNGWQFEIGLTAEDVLDVFSICLNVYQEENKPKKRKPRANDKVQTMD